jgi:hypothetical protein
VGFGCGKTVPEHGGNIYWLAGVTCDVLAESLHAAGSARSFTDSPDGEC